MKKKTTTLPVNQKNAESSLVLRDSIIECFTAMSLQDTYKAVVEQAIKLVGAKYGSVFVQKSEGIMHRAYASSGKLYQVIPRKNGNTYKVWKTGKAYIYAGSKVASYHPKFREFHVGTDLSVPLKCEDKTVGVLSVLSTEAKKFTQEELEILSKIAPYAAVAIKKAQESQKRAKALEAQDLFISMAAHELKNPLTSIKAYIQLMFRTVKKGKTPKLELVESLDREVIRVGKLIQEFLEVNQAKAGRLNYNFSNIVLATLVDHAVSTVRNNYPDKKIIKKLAPSIKQIKVNGDHDKLLQVFINLMENAAKFSEPGKNITIRVKKLQHAFVISIKDEGKGIAQTDLPHIFDQYYSGRQSPSGLGLGLFLVKRIIKAHNGKIKVRSQLGQGTEFIIHLPCNQTHS